MDRSSHNAGVVVEPLSSIQADCGSSYAAACYDPNQQIMFIPGEDPQAGVPLEEIVAHEHAHHIGLHSLNPPWQAWTYGPKRWASYEKICSRTAQGTAFPGDEGDHYTLNPAEAFAESYRVLNDVHYGASLSSVFWGIVDQSFFPDAITLRAVSQDVTAPWTANTAYGATGRFRSNGTHVRTYALKMPLDGVLVIRVRSSAGPYTVSVKSGGRVIAAGRGSSFTICGSRSAALVVHRRGRPGRFLLSASVP